MSPGKKKGAKATGGSLLTRLFGGGKKGGARAAAAGARQKGGKPAGNGKASADAGGGATKARPLTPLERSIQEIKQMAKVGERDPERLALLLSNLLAGEQAKRQRDQQKFERMVSDLVDRREPSSDDGA
ncbi:MAG: hypothetical protein ABIL09_27620 [Gemmatimonadota bacterium]